MFQPANLEFISKSWELAHLRDQLSSAALVVFQPTVTLTTMSKTKSPATGEGYLGETLVHKISRAVGIVESVTEAQAGWPPHITLKLANGSFKKGRLSDFREPTSGERGSISST